MTQLTPKECYTNNKDSHIIRLFIIRHGQTDNNVEKILQGHRDTDLNETGLNQSNLLGKYLHQNNITFDSVASSDLKRCKQTSMCVLNGIQNPQTTLHKIPLKFYSALRERYMGVIEGMYIEDAEKYADKHGKGSFKDFGEQPDVFIERLSNQITELVESAGDNVKNMAIVSHGGAIRAMLDWFKYQSSNEVDADGKTRKIIVFNTSVTIVDYNKQKSTFEVQQVGMTQHLGDGTFVVSDLRLR
ncbi:hypothetical protein TBLA_0D01040 [Henningerozyma blattae CBS 6284]|uniref:Phosphoglycerate mutase-like protein n=1 Tax=Henningerozyma blattae (strain ATCC 34711 / CBS 6284 / DSM 70876 / NBRC 10599 / NRRL Y-10934 / UCD 77-7) TaxID=1071380 RepID=I2H2L0_HENB6|nr:hypothetical protein TBLA_0D01040 [Tetrapisispora blattae CBS 6284]CCH60612.1 hypothetical protein TBLA_0D01040 [Tetrapisispora blattae CBS 6284]